MIRFIFLLSLFFYSSCNQKDINKVFSGKMVIKRSENQDQYAKISNENQIGKRIEKSNSEIESIYDKMLESKRKSYSNSYKVSVLLPLSGGNSQLGNAILDGIKMAMFDANSNNITLLPIDTSSLNMKIISDTIKEQNPDVVIGPVFSSEVESFVKEFRNIGSPIITMSNNKNLAKYQNVEVFGISPSDKIQTAIDYITSQERGTISLFLKSDSNSMDIQKIITEMAKKNKCAIISSVFYDLNYDRILSSAKSIAKNMTMTFNIGSDGSPFLVNIKNQKDANQKSIKKESKTLDVIITDAGGHLLDTVISAFDEAGIMKRDIMIISLSDSIEVGILNNNVSFVTYDRERFEIFKDIFRKSHNGLYPNHFSGLGYDVMGALSMLFSYGNFSKDTLHDQTGFSGVSGEFKFTEKGIVERKYSVYKISNGKIVKVI